MGWGHGGTHASRSLFSSCRIYLFFCDSEPPSLPPSLPLSPCSSPRSSSEPIPPEPFSWAPSSASSSAESFSDPGYAFDNSPYPPSTSSPSRPSSYLVLGRRFPGLHSSLVTPLRAARDFGLFVLDAEHAMETSMAVPPSLKAFFYEPKFQDICISWAGRRPSGASRAVLSLPGNPWAGFYSLGASWAGFSSPGRS